MPRNKTKILYIITQGHWGGAQKYVHDLAISLANNFDITVAVGEPDHNPDLQKKLKDVGTKHTQLQHLRRSISPIHDLMAIFELHKLYKKLKPDIVHLNSSKASILGTIATSNLKSETFNLVYTVHGWVFNEPMSSFKKKLYKFLEKWTSKKKTKIITLSENEKNIAIKILKIPKKKLEIIPVGIEQPKRILSKDDARQNILSRCKIGISVPLRQAKNDDKKDWLNSYIIGTIANFYPTKNLDSLINAVAKIKDKLNNFHLILIGDGPDRKKLEKLIKNGGLEKNVHILGFLENAEQYLPALDLFVLPSKKEGLPYTILEAKNNCVPVIATNVGAISTIIENKKTGLLVPPENIEKLSEAILYAYKNQGKMKKMSEAGKQENPPTYLKNTMVSETSNIYHSYPNN